MLEAQRLQFVAQATLEARPGAEQAKAGARLQHDGTRPLLAHQRTVPVRPGRQKPLRARFVLRVVIDGAYLRHQRMRCRQPHAGLQPGRGSGGIDRVQAAQLRRAFHQHQWRLRLFKPP